MVGTIGTSGDTYFGIPTHLGDMHKAAVLKMDAWFSDMQATVHTPLFAPLRDETLMHLWGRRKPLYREMSNAFLLDGDQEKGHAVLSAALAEFQAYLMAQIARLPEIHNDSQKGESP